MGAGAFASAGTAFTRVSGAALVLARRATRLDTRALMVAPRQVALRVAFFAREQREHQIDCMSAVFADQAEKYFFWRSAAGRAFYLKAYAFVWISEVWVRDMKQHEDRPISGLPIIGEQLQVIGVDATEECEILGWNVTRTGEASDPVLMPFTFSDDNLLRHIFFIKPMLAAMKMANA